MHKKLGLVTIYDCDNYGNRLQNYAVQHILESYGIETVTIRNVPYIEKQYLPIKDRIKKEIKDFILFPLRSRRHERAVEGWNNQFHGYPERYESFDKFNKLINFYPEWLSQYKLNIDTTNFFELAVGSDQVWNYKYDRDNKIGFLAFARDLPRIAISASLGVEELPNDRIQFYKKNLLKFRAISVRESTAKKIINKMLGNQIHVETLIDPTLAIDSNEWKKLLFNAKVSKLPSKYVLLMYLGELDDEMEKKINDYAAEYNCDIVRLNNQEVLQYYNYGPFEFLKAIDDADMVFTDSFHACCFSILFHKSFYVTKRVGKSNNDIFTRISTLLNLFGLENRILSKEQCIKISDEKFHMVDIILENERKRFKDFIERNILDIYKFGE